MGVGLRTWADNPVVGVGLRTWADNPIVGVGLRTWADNPVVGVGLRTWADNPIVGVGLRTWADNPIVGVGLRTSADNPGWGMEWTAFSSVSGSPFPSSLPHTYRPQGCRLKEVMSLSKGQRAKVRGTMGVNQSGLGLIRVSVHAWVPGLWDNFLLAKHLRLKLPE